MSFIVIFLLNTLFTFTLGKLPNISKSQFSEMLSNLLSNLPNDQNLLFRNPDEMKQFLIDQYDSEYNSNCKCGKRNTVPRSIKKVVSGYEAQPNEFPWQAQILRFKEDYAKFVHVCGGTLISSKWVLTAEHCFRHPYHGYTLDKSGYRVILGEHNRTAREESEKAEMGTGGMVPPL